MLNEVNNTNIWHQLRNGNSDALLSLYRENYLGLINFGCRITRNRELANDCITQILIKLWDKHAGLPEVKNVRSYLLTCLKHELLTELKKINKIKCGNTHFEYELPLEEISYEEYLIQTQTELDIKKNLTRAFSHLTKREKQLLQMKFFEDLSYDEIALRCKITKRTAYNIIHDALRALKADFINSGNVTVTNNSNALNKALPISIVMTILYLVYNFCCLF